MTEAPDGAPAARTSTVPSWTTVLPPAAVVVLAAVGGRDLAPLLVAAVALVLAGAVLAAVHHAEVVAHRVREPFGSLVLAVAVTVIEVALIVTLVASGGPETASLARDTVFAAVMITSTASSACRCSWRLAGTGSPSSTPRGRALRSPRWRRSPP